MGESINFATLNPANRGSSEETRSVEDSNNTRDTDVDMESSLKSVSPTDQLPDDGKHLLYTDLKNGSPMKTSDRLIDDILCDLSLNGQSQCLLSEQSQGILKLLPIIYSKQRQQLQNVSILGSLLDQVLFQTKFEYSSVSCPQHNKLQVFLGVLLNVSSSFESTDDVVRSPLFHLKVTVKTRSQLELYKKHAGVSQFFSVDSLHSYDKEDLGTFDPEDTRLIDYAIYVSSDTNKLVLIEIFHPEFNTSEEIESFTVDGIRKRYVDTCSRLDSLNPEDIPNQFDCLNTLYKTFKNPINKTDPSAPLQTIKASNPILNSHMNANWLTERYGFTLLPGENEDDEDEYEPPNFTTYIMDPKVRKMKECYIRKCLQLIFWAKLMIEVVDNTQRSKLAASSKSFKSLSGIAVQNTSKPLYQLFGESKNAFLNSNDQNYMWDTNYHFIALSASYHYNDRDIIMNYETYSVIDKGNIGIYFDAIQFIANRKGSYQLLAYCGKQNIVGHEALEAAMRAFKLDPAAIDINKLDISLLLSMYKHEQISNQNTSHLSDLKNALRVLAKFKDNRFVKFYVDHEPYKTVSQAYNELEVDESVDDDIIQTAYSIKVNDSPGLKIECIRALYTIAINKRSMALFNYLIEECPEFQDFYGPEKYSYEQALAIIQVNENASDEMILQIFQKKWNDEPLVEYDQFLSLKAALLKLCIEKNSKLISHFLTTGLIDPSCLPVENWPIGLNNIGNTCYLNSLLQYYFAIAPLRNYICSYQSTTESFEATDTDAKINRRIGGRQVCASEVERSIQFTYQLRDLFNGMIFSNSRCVSPTQELAYLAFSPSNIEVEFDAGSGIASESGGTFSLNGKDTDAPLTDMPLNEDVTMTEAGEPQLDDTGLLAPVEADVPVDQMKLAKEVINSSTKVAKIGSDQLENALELGRQQDVTECIGNVLYQLESASDPIKLDEDNEQYDLIKHLFYGKTRQDIVPLSNSTDVRSKYERFLSLLVNVSDHPKDIYDALDSYFMEEYLTLEEYGDVRRTVAITEFPTILQIQIQRVYYDRERFMPFKSIEPIPFNSTLYMDRYAATDDPVMLTKRRETSELKTRLRECKVRQQELLSRNDMGLSRKEAYTETMKMLQSDFLEQVPSVRGEDQTAVVSGLSDMVASIDEELVQLYTEIGQLETQIDHQFDSFQKVGYSLFAVFIHRGEASYGHYWVYVKDFKNSGIWRKYNDETVSEVPEEEVFNFTEGNNATPYFLVLVKQTHEQDIEPLHRIIDNTQR
ncbi:ubiquitin-specific protease UBP2 KNAG_0B04190 [Huiozyma naganishii CBS 8797]|uniref:Ubiquitin carboxyl-terminal hydrolase 2 n=1 Tax=Huiozyma naganishii (strain ATCC MYA-139 / BCRC 22969 / CBS 8797 / KCTC 17520 / NBRC 10181 / NCYC 3082 / Yp74L-3) TaxID=1071383 RepID=J7S3Q7_HUIN7|nr:hypothetical protein KNAG_0B04190 [Kazachstania naganishii CBS 8797]CCK68854.1 hypothetical protein KNAG_0B04190 [Kazachstania naganishii CBS 8797]